MKNNKLDRIFFLGISIWFLLVLVWGFSPSFYFRSATQEPLRIPLIYHGIFATCWFIIFFIQCLLLSTSKYRKFHFRLGWVGLFILFGTIVSGLITTFTQVGDTPESIGDSFMHFLLVLGFAGIGIIYRKTPFVHKRLLVFASAILSSAAVARVDFFGFKIGATYYTFYVIMFFAVIALLIYDMIFYKKVFKVSLICSIISYIMLIHTHFIWESKVWSDIVHLIINK
jgi:hypothetical protein